jgi:hypothetical protein
MTVWDLDRDQWWPNHIIESAWLGHTPFAAWLIPNLEPKVIVELGTHQAVSYMAFCQANAKITDPARCFAVDTWQGDDHAGKYDDSVFHNVQKLNERYEQFSTLLRCRFDEALNQFEDGTVDLLHIDGLHTYEAVSQDFYSWLPKMSDRGVVLFHDTEVRDRDFGVWRLWEELIKQYPSFSFQHGFGLGVLVVGRDAPENILKVCQPNEASDFAKDFRSLFSRYGNEVIEHYQLLHEAEEKKSLSGRWKHAMKTTWRSYVPISIRKTLKTFR